MQQQLKIKHRNHILYKKIACGCGKPLAHDALIIVFEWRAC